MINKLVKLKMVFDTKMLPLVHIYTPEIARIRKKYQLTDCIVCLSWVVLHQDWLLKGKFETSSNT